MSSNNNFKPIIRDSHACSGEKGEDRVAPQNGSAAFSSGRKAMSPLRHRSLMRSATLGDLTSPSERRRSSFMDADSVDRESMKSSMSDLLLPRAVLPGQNTQNEPSHLHSAPLLLALLPALGGVLFNNGSAMLTDLTLLILAAIFLNWCVRLPWDWYHSTQSIRTQAQVPYETSDAIIEEDRDEDKEEGAKNEDEYLNKPKGDDNAQKDDTENAKDIPSARQSAAASELRTHEVLALLACFLGPIFGAWLLHTVRFQLSRPSEGLVSDYNLSIFLLAAEIRPVSHVLTLIQSRTMYLQRMVATNPHTPQPTELAIPKEILARLDELESHAVSTVNEAKAKAGEPRTPQLVAEVRKSIQPELDALNRAVRRYEKRVTVFNMQIESQLQNLESRTKDALSLAAAAERGRKGSAAILLDFLAAIVVVPGQAMLAILSAAVAIPKAAAETSLDLILNYTSGFWARLGNGRGKRQGKEKEREGPAKKKAKRLE